MVPKILEFIERHSVLSVAILIFLCIAGVSLAASPSFFKYIFSSEETITSVDNTVIVNTDLDNMDANVKINSVKVDNGSFRVDYSHDTLGLDNGFWKKTGVDKSIVVDKHALMDQNAGTYLAKKMIDDIDSEFALLKEIQAEEKSKGITQKIVTTTYTGIVGSLIGSTQIVVVNTSTNTSIASSTTAGTTSSTTSQQIIAQTINNLIAQAQNPPPTPSPNPLPNTTPPAVAGPNPPGTPLLTPVPTPVIPVTPTPINQPNPLPAPAPNPGYSPTPGYMYLPVYPSYTESPDVVNVGALPQ